MYLEKLSEPGVIAHSDSAGISTSRPPHPRVFHSFRVQNKTKQTRISSCKFRCRYLESQTDTDMYALNILVLKHLPAKIVNKLHKLPYNCKSFALHRNHLLYGRILKVYNNWLLPNCYYALFVISINNKIPPYIRTLHNKICFFFWVIH